MTVICDIEVFKTMNMVGFLKDNKAFMCFNVEGLEPTSFNYLGVTIFVNQPKRNLACMRLLPEIVGFNNHNYDDYLIEQILSSQSYQEIKNKSDELVKAKFPPRQRFKWWSYDLEEQMPIGFSLKKFESMRGLSVLESSIPFDYEGYFSIEMLKEIAKYNLQDLQASQELFNIRSNYFKSKTLLADKYGFPGSNRYSNGTITGSYLFGYENLKNYKPKYIELNGIPNDAKQFLANAYSIAPEISMIKNKADREKAKNKEWSSLVLENHGCVYTWSWGGMHASRGHIKKTAKRSTPVYNYVDERGIWQVDVTSMFPNIMIRDNLLGQATDKFKNLVADRVKNKREGNPIQSAQKIVINSVYGLLRLQSSKLFNPRCAIAVNVAGMVAIYNLADQLSKIGDIIQVNTDGVAFKPHKYMTEDELKECCAQWENDFQLNLEYTFFNRFIQKDVNNYVATKDEQFNNYNKEMFVNSKKEAAKKIKLKGGQLTQAFYVDYTKSSNPTILNRLLLALLLGANNIDLVKICEDAKLRDFCFTLAATRGKTQTGLSVLGNGEKLSQRVNRVYASKTGQAIFKEKTNGTLAKYPNVPETVTIANQDITDKYSSDIDFKYYIQLAKSNYEKWLKNK